MVYVENRFHKIDKINDAEMKKRPDVLVTLNEILLGIRIKSNDELISIKIKGGINVKQLIGFIVGTAIIVGIGVWFVEKNPLMFQKMLDWAFTKMGIN